MVGDIYHKRAGEWRCNICVEPDPVDPNEGHCISPTGELTAFADEPSCPNDHTWSTSHQCYNDIATEICAVPVPEHFRKYGEWCQQPGADWLDTYSGLARVDAGGEVVRLSTDDEIVTRAWSLDDRLAYSAFNAPLGRYELREVVEGGSQTLLEDVEIYELIVDPRAEGKWFLNACGFRTTRTSSGPSTPRPSSSTSRPA